MDVSLKNNIALQVIYILLCFLLIDLECIASDKEENYEVTPLYSSSVFITDSSSESTSVSVESNTKTFDGGRLKSSLVLHKNYENSTYAEFIETADQIFFYTPDSSKVRGAGIAGAMSGLAPSTVMTGLILKSIGDFLGIPPGLGGSIILSTGIMVTTTPVFARQLYERGRTIMAYFAKEEAFQNGVIKLENGDAVSFTYQKSDAHHLMNSVIFFTTIIEATFYTSLMVTAEEKFPVVAAITGAPFFFSFWERYYNIGAYHIHDLFNAHYYGNKDIREKRSVLLLMIKQFQKAVAENSSFAKEIYDKIRWEVRCLKTNHKSDLTNIKCYFALSALLLKSVEEDPKKSQATLLEEEHPKEEKEEEEDKKDEIIKKLREENNKLKRYQAQIERLAPSLSEEFLGYLSILTTGFASGGRLASSQYILETLLAAVFSGDTAYTLAWIGAGVDLGIRIGTEYKAQNNFFQSCRTWSCNDFLDGVRNGIGTNALAYGGLFALARTIPGLANFARWGAVPKVFQAATLFPAFVGDTVYYQRFLKEKGQNLLIALITTIPKKHTVECGTYQPSIVKERSDCNKNCTEKWRKYAVKAMPAAMKQSIRRNARHAWLYKWSEELYRLIEYSWSDQAIDFFYKITQEDNNIRSPLKSDQQTFSYRDGLTGETESTEELI